MIKTPKNHQFGLKENHAKSKTKAIPKGQEWPRIAPPCSNVNGGKADEVAEAYSACVSANSPDRIEAHQSLS
jgi:hypothetical protein